MKIKKLDIAVSDEIRSRCPDFRGAAVYAEVRNSAYNEALWQRIGEYVELYRSKYTVDSIKEMKSIQATRTAYKKCGKDPSRYRPSSEALCRRLLQGKDLYQIDTLVDLVNLASINSGHSIGGFDYDKIEAGPLVLGIGRAGEPYEGIGRGELNIEGLPVYRDAKGGIGTPTSDNERTKMDLDTRHILAIMNAYSGSEGLDGYVKFMTGLLEEFAGATDIETIYFE